MPVQPTPKQEEVFGKLSAYLLQHGYPYSGDDGWVAGTIKKIHKCLNDDKIPSADFKYDYYNYIKSVNAKH